MKGPLLPGIALCALLSMSPAFAEIGGGGSSLGPVTGGAFGTSAASPGTNSSGTALSSTIGNGRKKNGPLLGTGNAALGRENARVDRMVRSICRGC